MQNCFESEYGSEFFKYFLKDSLMRKEKIKIGNVTFSYNDSGNLAWDLPSSQWNEDLMSKDLVELV